MPTLKTTRFDALTIGTEFVVPDEILPIDQLVVFVKKATLSARKRDLAVSPAIPFRACDKVATVVPDPTPEEIAAKAEQDRVWAEQWFARRLKSFTEAAEATVARFQERVMTDPSYAFEWGTDAAIAAGKLRAFRNVQAVLDEKGTDAAKAYAIARVLEGARCPNHSTAALANLVIESVTAGYAEIASL